jgi:membrane-associated protease RseP (regulator of RpoE activity)
MATSIAAFLIVITILVFVHELGHYVMARWHGVRVLTFSVGFGPKLLRMHAGGTEYCLCAIPFGGYVQMATGTPGSTNPDEFMAQRWWARVQIFAAGPVMNFALAVVALYALLLFRGVEAHAAAAGGSGVPSAVVHMTAWQAAAVAVGTTFELARGVLVALFGLVSGHIAVDQLVGPVGIAQLAGDSARAGWFESLALLALISVNLGVLNLMPLPVLDGGHILLMTIEDIRGRHLTAPVRKRILQAGLAMLLAGMVTSLYNDVNRLRQVQATNAGPSRDLVADAAR